MKSIDIRRFFVCLILACVLGGHAQADPGNAATRAATVHLDGGSGVCISPDGWIVTAAHMLPGWPFDPPHLRPRHNPWLPGQTPPLRRPPESVAVTWETGQKLTARVRIVKDSDQRTDIAILKAEGNNLPFRPLSKRAPAVGDAVFAAGYPGGNWAWNESRVIAIGPIPITSKYQGQERTELSEVIQVNYRAAPGGSGGPLLNLNREVIGVCSRATVEGNQRTMFSRWEHITAALLEAGYSPTSETSTLPALQAWSQDPRRCAPCKHWKDDFARGIYCNGVLLQEAFRVDQYDIDQQPELAARLGITSAPTFIAPDGSHIVGYTDAATLCAQLVRFQFPIVSGVDPPPPTPDPAFPAPPPPTQTPATSPTTPPAATTEEPPPDVAAVRLVVLVQKLGETSWGIKSWIKGIALTRGEKLIESKLPALVREKIGGKARASIIFQRLHPTRFDEVQGAATVEPAKVSIVVLVSDRYDGAAGKLAAFLEPKLVALSALHNETADVTLIFERSEEERYHAVIDALAEEEPLASPETLVTGGTAVGAGSGLLWWFFKRRRTVAPAPVQTVPPVAA